MTYHELLHLIVSSGPGDWLDDDERGIFTLKTDLDVTLREVRKDEDYEPRPFEEEWATRYPNPTAYSVQFELWFRSSFVKVYYFVSVDGHRALIPFPKSRDDLTITHEQFAVAQAVNLSAGESYFSEYIREFTVEG